MNNKRWLTRDNYKLVLLFICFWTPLILFFKIAGEIIEREPIRGDIAILNWLHSHANPFLDHLLLTATNIGGAIGMTVITSLLLMYFLYKHQVRKATILVACVGGVTIANIILKGLFHRDRPSLFKSSVVETSFSFPSGHAMASSALILCLVLLYWNTKWRWPIAIAGTVLVLTVGISRPYFGVHYPSDIIAGWCASTGWVLLMFFVINKIRAHRTEAEVSEQRNSDTQD